MRRCGWGGMVLWVALSQPAWGRCVKQEVPVSTDEPNAVGYNEVSAPNGAGLDWRRARTKCLDLTLVGAPSKIVNSQVVQREPQGLQWKSRDKDRCLPRHLWRSGRFRGHTRFLALFKGTFCEGGGGPAEWTAGVIMADIDADTNNNSKAFQRPPTVGGREGDREERFEQAPLLGRGILPARKFPGLIVCVNRGFEEGGLNDLEEDFEKRGIVVDDEDLLQGSVALKLPKQGGREVKGRASLTYDASRVRVYLVIDGAAALIPSGTPFPVEEAPALSPPSSGAPDGQVTQFGRDNTLLIEGLKTSTAVGGDDILVTLTPEKGKPSKDKLLYTAVEVDATRERCNPATSVKLACIAQPTEAILRRVRDGRGNVVRRRVASALKDEAPEAAFFVYVEDVDERRNKVRVVVKSFLPDGKTQIDEIRPGNRPFNIPECKRRQGRTYASGECWVVPNTTDPTVNLDDNRNTIRGVPGGRIVIEYRKRGTTAVCTKEMVVVSLEITDTPLAYLPTNSNAVRFTATIKPSRFKRKIRLSLLKVSDFPGDAMNHGTQSDTDPDFKFLASANPGMTIGGNGLTAETTTAVNAVSVTVSSFDYGSRGRIQAEILDGDLPCKSQDRRIPKDTDGDSLPDAYENLHANFDPKRKDSDGDGIDDGVEDDEVVPVASGSPRFGRTGDGLVAFEEYRGFFIRGRHHRTSPLHKDFFARSTVVARGMPMGLGFLPSAPITVHHIRQSEWNGDIARVINFQRSGILGATPQRGVLCENASLVGNFGLTLTGGDPNSTVFCHVDVSAHVNAPVMGRLNGNRMRLLTPAESLDLLRETIAHEFGHSIGIDHYFLPTRRRDVMLSDVVLPIPRRYDTRSIRQIRLHQKHR